MSESEGRDRLVPGRVYSGTVAQVHGGLCKVAIDGTGYAVPNAVPMVGVVLGIAGVRTSVVFEPGDKVALAYGNPSYIVGLGARDLPDTANPASRTMTGQPVPAEPPGPGLGHPPPNDLLGGEFEMGNLMGSAVTLLANMVQVKSGDRAKIECLLLDDMVRIVSGHFKHHSAWGDVEIYNDGRLNVAINGTSYEHESFGAESKEGPFIPMKGNHADLDAIDAVMDSGRWRLSAYFGFLGDFAHMIVHDPQKTLEKAASKPASGRARIWAGQDGAVLVQSTSDIVLERVTRIPVPVRLKRHEDPQGVRPEDYDRLERDFLRIWEQDDDTLHHTAYQLREYARWLSNFHSFARFHQLAEKGEWKVPSESESAAPEPGCGEDDRKGANAGAEYREVYATMRIFGDGSILQQDGMGSAVMMAGGDVHVSAARNLLLEAAGDIVLAAGGNLILKARRSVEILASLGGIVAKSRAFFRMLCEKGSLWLRSEAPDPNQDGYEEEDTPEGQPEPEVLDYGVLIESKGRTLLDSGRQLRLYAGGSPDDDSDTGADLFLETKKAAIRLFPHKSFGIETPGDLYFGAKKSCLVESARFYAKTTGGSFFDKILAIRPDGVHAAGMKTEKMLVSEILRGPRRGPTPRDADNPPRVPSHDGHVSVYEPELPNGEENPNKPKPPDDDDLEDRDKILDDRAEAKENKELPGPVWADSKNALWGFLGKDAYDWQEDGEWFESMTQQKLRLDGLGDDVELEDWSFADDAASGPRIDSTRRHPWGGALKHLAYGGGEPLDKPSSAAPGAFGNSGEPLKQAAMTMKCRKPKEQ